jgi:hypothetical protein
VLPTHAGRQALPVRFVGARRSALDEAAAPAVAGFRSGASRRKCGMDRSGSPDHDDRTIECCGLDLYSDVGIALFSPLAVTGDPRSRELAVAALFQRGLCGTRPTVRGSPG